MLHPINSPRQAIQEIRDELGPEVDDIISTDPDDLHAHGYSEWSSTNPDGLPVAVAYPRSTAQVSTIARICHKYRVPIIPYSGGSSLEGNFSAPFGGVSVDFAFMDRIVQFNREDMDIVVQPSIGWQDLNEQLAAMGSGLFFPVDPGEFGDWERVRERIFRPSGCVELCRLTENKNNRPVCESRRHDRDKLFRDQRGKVWHYEGLGDQPDRGAG